SAWQRSDEAPSRAPGVCQEPLLAVASGGSWHTPGARDGASSERCHAERYMPFELGRWWRYRVTDPATGRADPSDKTIVFDRYGDVGGAKAGVIAFRLARSDESGTAFRWLRDTGRAAVWELDAWFDPAGRPA